MGVSYVVRPGILDSALWTVKDGLFMCTCKNKHSEEDYEVEDKVVAALEKGIMAADVRHLITKRDSRLMRVETGQFG